MKKIIYLLPVLALFFSACNPLDDINTQIDAQVNPIVGDATYTLSDADYKALDLTYGSFSSLNDAKTMLPAFLTGKYPTWGKGSSVLVDYKLYVGAAEGVSDYTGATTYQLANKDYPGYVDNGFAFYPTDDIGTLLPTILDANISSPTEGQMILVSYNKYVSTPVVGITNYYEADFKTAQTLLDYEATNVIGAQVWGPTTSYGAKMSGYLAGNQDNEDWLISPEIDLTTQTNLSFQLNQAINYASGHLELLNVLVSTDYTTGGDPNAATWDTISLTNIPPGTNWTFVTSDDYDFSAYEGKKIHIAFKYESNSTAAATWEIADAVIKTPGVTGDMTSEQVYYKYTGGAWVSAQSGVYILTKDDYNSMGEASGQPGKYDNFDSSMSPDTYISTFLGLKYPYAKDKDELIVIYKYYSGGVQTRGNLYTVVGGVWTGHLSTQETTLQFAHDGTTWVPDNTIKYELVNADYEYLSAQLATDSEYADLYVSLGKYHDFDYHWTEAQIVHALGILADYINPTAAEGQKYSFTYLLYDNGTNKVSKNIIKTNGVWVLNN